MSQSIEVREILERLGSALKQLEAIESLTAGGEVYIMPLLNGAVRRIRLVLIELVESQRDLISLMRERGLIDTQIDRERIQYSEPQALDDGQGKDVGLSDESGGNGGGSARS